MKRLACKFLRQTVVQSQLSPHRNFCSRILQLSKNLPYYLAQSITINIGAKAARPLIPDLLGLSRNATIGFAAKH